MAEIIEPRDLNGAALLNARVHPALTGLDGAGIVICVIDYGFDLLHPALRTATGETRFAALLDQNGARLSRAEINALLRAADRSGSREAIDAIYDPHAAYFGRAGVEVGAHGSWVASIAAGSRTPHSSCGATSKTAFSGVAPNAMLIGVQLGLPDSAWREEDADGQPTWLQAAARGPDALAAWNGWRSYEDSPAIIDALEDSVACARTLKPDGIVVNLSIGAWAGGHDPGSAVNRAIEAIIDTGRQPGAPMIAVVAGAGNAGADAGHVSGHVSTANPLRFAWSFIPGRQAQSKLEIWTDCPGGVTVEVAPRSRGGESICTLDGTAPSVLAIRLGGGQIIGVGENRGLVRGGLSAVRILLHPAASTPASSGDTAFDITVRPAHADQCGVAHAWLERDCSNGALAKLEQTLIKTGQTIGVKDDNSRLKSCESTLTSIACAASAIAVAGLDTGAADDAVIAMSGRGPRPWSAPAHFPAPLLAAPANGLFGARSKTTGYMRGSGTSGAAAIVSGAAALAMQGAALAGRRLDTIALIAILLGRSIDLNSNDNWRSDIGFGPLRFDVSAALGDGIYPRKTAHPRKEVESDERTISPAV